MSRPAASEKGQGCPNSAKRQFFNWLPGRKLLMRRSTSGRNADGIRQPLQYRRSSDTTNVVSMQASFERQIRQINSCMAQEKAAQSKQQRNAGAKENEDRIPAATPKAPNSSVTDEKLSH